MKIKNQMNKLRTRLSNQELVEEIKKVTEIGNPASVMFFYFWDYLKHLFKLEEIKPFYGFVNEKGFKITFYNQFFLAPYILEGNFLEIEDKIELRFNVKRVWYIFLFLYLVSMLFSVVLFLIIYSTFSLLPFEGKFMILLISFFFLLGIFSPLLVAEFIKRKQLKKRFISYLSHIEK